MKDFTKLTTREYSLPVRLLVTTSAGLIFALLIPISLIELAPRLDTVFHLSRISPGLASGIPGGILMLLGFFFALWSISDQLFLARGTPIPVVATQVLLIRGPFKLCRNPMGFGAITAYLGISILSGSISSIFCVVVFAVLFILYVKKFEELELEARFGQPYLDYKASTPFIIPLSGSRKNKG
jgi:protein-S-isoprenylcysteine O-methyltransferase Ste14